MRNSRKPWIILPNPSGPVRLRLFCFPYAGGGAAVFRGWKEGFPSTLQVCPIQLPGREEQFSDPPLTRVSQVVAELEKQILPLLDLPFAFFGHSMGALVAFELARALRRANAPMPVELLVSGRRAPDMPDRKPALHDLPEKEFRTELRKLEGTPEAILDNHELMDLLSPTLRADFALCETYAFTTEEPLRIPIRVFGGFDDPETTGEELKGWRHHTAHYRPLRMFEGNHFFLQQNSAAVVKAIYEDLQGLG